jgi:WD40 repeat protein
MTDQRELDRILGAFFVEGTNELPDRVISAALEQIDHTPQRHAARTPWRLPRMNTFARVAAAAVLGLFAIGGTLYLAGLRQLPVGPSASLHESATPSELAVPAAVIVFNRAVGEETRLWVANADGSEARELAPDLGGCQGWPAWSPDGTRLLFSRIECGFMTGLGDASTRLYLTDASGSETQMVDTGCVRPCLSDSNGVFSSDGRRILFLRLNSIDEPSATPAIAGKPAPSTEIWVLAEMDLATGRVTELAELSRSSPPSNPHWSPDRTQVVFDREIPSESPTDGAGSPEVMVADADGQKLHRVSPYDWSSFSAGWSPDGTRILFQGIQYTSVGDEIRAFSDLYTVRPDGTGLRRLTTDQISSNAAWSVDGRIWFIRTPRVNGNLQTDGPPQYWVMDADGSNPEQLSGPPPAQGWLLQPTP